VSLSFFSVLLILFYLNRNVVTQVLLPSNVPILPLACRSDPLIDRLILRSLGSQSSKKPFLKVAMVSSTKTFPFWSVALTSNFISDNSP